jgi:DNA-binding ferritin-like protein (Dps family)
MAKNIIEMVVGDLDDKRKWRASHARIKALPRGYREAGKAIERYVMYLGPSNDGKTLIRIVGDLADLLEQSAADGTPVRAVVGADPVEFAETFLDNYSEARWITKERRRLAEAIDAIDGTDAHGSEDGTS